MQTSDPQALADRQTQRLRSLQHLVGVAAKDFDLVLQLVDGNLHLLGRTLPDDHPARPRLEAAVEGVGRGAMLVAHLRDLSRDEEPPSGTAAGAPV